MHFSTFRRDLVYRLFTALTMLPKAHTMYVETELAMTIMSTIFFLFSFRVRIQSTGGAILRTLVQNISERNISSECTEMLDTKFQNEYFQLTFRKI